MKSHFLPTCAAHTRSTDTVQARVFCKLKHCVCVCVCAARCSSAENAVSRLTEIDKRLNCQLSGNHVARRASMALGCALLRASSAAFGDDAPEASAILTGLKKASRLTLEKGGTPTHQVSPCIMDKLFHSAWSTCADRMGALSVVMGVNNIPYIAFIWGHSHGRCGKQKLRH